MARVKTYTAAKIDELLNSLRAELLAHADDGSLHGGGSTGGTGGTGGSTTTPTTGWTAIATETANTDGPLNGTPTTTGGLTWAGLFDTALRRLGGRVVPAAGGPLGVSVVTLPSADGAVAATAVTGTTDNLSTWLYARYVGGTGILLQRNMNGVTLYKQVNGATTEIGSKAVSLPGTAEQIMLSCYGNTIEVWVAGILQLSVVDSTGSTQTSFGVRLAGDGSANFDDITFYKRSA